MKDLVSIITPAYKTRAFIEETIRSVQRQTYTNWEMIIVDDCSNDGTREAVEAMGDPRIQFYTNEKNQGAAVSRNKALQLAKGRWVAFLDSDDLWEPEKLEKQIAFMDSHGYHFSYTDYIEVDEDGRELGVRYTGPNRIGKMAMYSFNYMGCLTVMYDREFVGLVQVADLKKRNDYAIWVRAVQKCPSYRLGEVLARYRIRKSGSIMNRSQGVMARMKHNYYLWRDGEKMPRVCALLMTGVNFVFGTLKKIVFKKSYQPEG